METKEYIVSEILELYVYGLLSETENEEINTMSDTHTEIKAEIITNKKVIVAISSSFTPFYSVANYKKIKAKLGLKHSPVVEMNSSRNRVIYMRWAAAVLLMIGIGFQYNQLERTSNQVVSTEIEKVKIKKKLNELSIKNTQNKTS